MAWYSFGVASDHDTLLLSYYHIITYRLEYRMYNFYLLPSAIPDFSYLFLPIFAEIANGNYPASAASGLAKNGRLYSPFYHSIQQSDSQTKSESQILSYH